MSSHLERAQRRTERAMLKPLHERSLADISFIMGYCGDLDYEEFVTNLRAMHDKIREKPPTTREKKLIALLACSEDASQAGLGVGAIVLQLPPQESAPMLATIYQLARAPETKQTIRKILRPPKGINFETHIENLIAQNFDFHQSILHDYSPSVEPLPADAMPNVHRSIIPDFYPPSL